MMSGKSIAYELVGSGLFIGMALLSVSVAELGFTENPNMVIRLFCIFCGLVLVGYANAAPKRLVQYEPDSDRPARMQACLRFCAWAFTLGGIGYSAIWIFAPIESAAQWSLLPLAIAFLLVAVRRGSAARREA